MVRLVFRPYTQVRKAICTSAHLRASTRVSSGFALIRHSSPSFGSQQVRSYSNLSQKIMVGRWCRLPLPSFGFPSPRGFSTHRLAYMLDSLVRVSRRASRTPSASTLQAQIHEWSKRMFASVHRQVGTRNKSGIYPHRHTRADQPLEHTDPSLGDISQGAPRRPTASPPTISGTISLSLQSSFHLSLAVLVRYRSLALI